MKYAFIILLSALLTFSLAAQEQRSRVKRETGNEQPAEARERKVIVLELSRKRLDLFERGDKERLSVLRSASGEIPPEVRWISDDPAIARIDENGYVEPAGPGSTTVWAQAADGRRTGKCIVTVTKPLKWGSVSGKDRLVVQEPWVYFSNKADNGKLYKVLINGSSLMKLSDDIPANLNVTGQWMYYYNLNEDTQKGVYRMSVEGKMRTCLIDNDFVSYLRVNRDGWMFYLNGDNEVYALRTHKPNEPRRKMFDERPVYSMAVNDYYIVYNRHWEDSPQPQGGGGLFLYDMKENNREEYVSVNRNTRLRPRGAQPRDSINNRILQQAIPMVQVDFWATGVFAFRRRSESLGTEPSRMPCLRFRDRFAAWELSIRTDTGREVHSDDSCAAAAGDRGRLIPFGLVPLAFR